MKAIAAVEKANKIYKSGDTTITALDATDLTIYTGEVLLIIGPSGSGKTTLLSLLGCVIYPTEGKVVINGIETTNLNATQMAKLRLENIGFVFQSFNLIAPLTAEENVMYPLQLLGFSASEARKKAQVALATVGMSDRRKNLPRQLSGGQQQRVSIARALVTNPPLLLCDEPTASLDSQSVKIVMDELVGLARQDKAVVIVTHDYRLKDYADKIIEVESGKVSFSSKEKMRH
ncbi:MAG: ABC transporter ATP-binding protein [Bacteroidia bacterium]